MINVKSFDVIVDVGNINLENLTSENAEKKKEFVTEEIALLIKPKKNINRSDIVSYKPEKVTVKVLIDK